MVLRTRKRTVRYEIGGCGITRAVFIDVAGANQARMGPLVTGSWGELQLQNHEGCLVARIEVRNWLPEAPLLPRRWIHGEQLLGRSGVASLLETAGIPLRVVRDRDDPLVAPAGFRRSLDPGTAFPAWYWATRLLAGSLWFVAFTVFVFSEPGSTA
ncbi:hypothetical protein [Streptomyces sp. HSG2]|uniref:hypothetical protein n=1 Tax=Streptomyces sp. HSG2 TaxID=2797167 RepID=UPI0019073C1F|nr:hypothetical protein [Streptomyces sp. HSG2]